jgi:hypothetical protein
VTVRQRKLYRLFGLSRSNVEGMSREWLGGRQLGGATTWVQTRLVATIAVVEADPEARNGAASVSVVATLRDGTDVFLATFPSRSDAIEWVEGEMANGTTVTGR